MAKGDDLDLVLANLDSGLDWHLLARILGLQELETNAPEVPDKPTDFNRAIRRIYGSGPRALVRKITGDDIYYPDYIHIVRHVAKIHGLLIQDEDTVLIIEMELLNKVKVSENQIHLDSPIRNPDDNDSRLLDIVIMIALLRRKMIKTFSSFILGE